MKLTTKTLILIASATLCASCSSYYSRHAKGAGMNTNSQSNHQRFVKQDTTATTQGVNLAQDVNESDNDIIEEADQPTTDNPMVNNQKVAQSDVRVSAFQGLAKCRPTQPIGGTEQHFYFGFDRDSVVQSDFDTLKTQAQFLLDHPNMKIRVEGNADDRGSREYNIALAARRAKAIIKALKQQGVREDQCTIVSYGAEKPAAKGENDEAYHCNRRVDIVYEAAQ